MVWNLAFYMNADGDTPVADFLLSLSDKEYDKCMQYVVILTENGPRLPSQYAKHIKDGLWELRPEFGGTEMRLFYFIFVDNLLVILHGCKKVGKGRFKGRSRSRFGAWRRFGHEDCENQTSKRKRTPRSTAQ
jgi:hypothetical protein